MNKEGFIPTESITPVIDLTDSKTQQSSVEPKKPVGFTPEESARLKRVVENVRTAEHMHPHVRNVLNNPFDLWGEVVRPVAEAITRRLNRI